MTLSAEALQRYAADLRGPPPDPRMAANAAYAEPLDPERWFREVLGRKLETRDQKRAIQKYVDSDGLGRHCYTGGTASGKSDIGARLLLYTWTCRGCLLGDNGQPKGCELILTAPTQGSVMGTVYGHIHRSAKLAADNGHWIPGYAKDGRYPGASATAVNWHHQKPLWNMRSVTASAKVGEEVAHSISGVHPAGWLGVGVEEASGVGPHVQLAIIGLASAGNVLVLQATNPTSPFGDFATRVLAEPDRWHRVTFSQVDHPNVLRRRTVIPGSISHLELEIALRSAQFENRGPAGSVDLEPSRLDFVYALPDPGMPDEPGPRPDGIPGHPRADPVVLRPTGPVPAGLHLGDWLVESAEGLLFDVPKMRRIMSSPAPQPEGPPDRVGVDCAGARAPWATPAWGPTARDAYDAGAPAGSIRVGKAVEIAYSGNDEVAKARASAVDLLARWGLEPLYIFDQAFGGGVAMALADKGAQTVSVPFGDSPQGLPLELYAPPANRRAQLFAEAAAASNAGIVSWQWSQKLLEEAQAIGELVIKPNGKGLIRKKEDIVQSLGRQIDRIDTAVLALSGIPSADWYLGAGGPGEAAGEPGRLHNRIEDM